MTSCPDIRSSEPGGWHTHWLLVALILLGWVYALAQVLTLDTPVSLAEAGPGMQIFAFIKAYVFGDPFAFESSLSFCSSAKGIWGVADVLKSAAMWLGMILAMMLPVLLPLNHNASMRPRSSIVTSAKLAGYISAWLPFCAMAVVAQWALQRAGLLSAHQVLQHDGLSAAILLFVALVYLSRTFMPHKLKMQATEHDQSYCAGLYYGRYCQRCCGPLMIVMFITGLMNMVAMLVFTLLMVGTMSGYNRPLSIAIGMAGLAGATGFAVM